MKFPIIYLGIGVALHALFVGATFDWSSAWTLGWLIGWPVMLFVWSVMNIVKVAIFILAFCLVAGTVSFVWEQTWVWRHQRSARRAARKAMRR